MWFLTFLVSKTINCHMLTHITHISYWRDDTFYFQQALQISFYDLQCHFQPAILSRFLQNRNSSVCLFIFRKWKQWNEITMINQSLLKKEWCFIEWNYFIRYAFHPFVQLLRWFIFKMFDTGKNVPLILLVEYYFIF